MKQNTKFLWIYTAILFSFALILILFAGLTQNNFQKELIEQENASKGMQESVSQLTEHNQALTDELKKVNAELSESKQLYAELESKTTALEKMDALLAEAMWLKDSGKSSEAKALVKDLDQNALTESQKYWYEKIKK